MLLIFDDILLKSDAKFKFADKNVYLFKEKVPDLSILV